MFKVNFSITIPENPQELRGLSELVHAKHVVDGAASKLAGLDMADLLIKKNSAKTFDETAGQQNRDKEQAFEDRDLLLGVKNNNPGTLNFYAKSCRDVLLGLNRGQERKLGGWGFNVQGEGADFSVEIPEEAPDLMKLCELIIAKHVADGAASVLTGLDMADFTAKQAQALAKHDLGKKLNRDKETSFKDRDRVLGISVGQTTRTPGTVKFYMTSARDVLLGFNKQEEYRLGDWGFEVQFSQGAGSPTGTFKRTPSVIAAGGTSTLEWNISGATLVQIDNGIGAVGDTGTQIVNPAVTTVYRLTANAANGKQLVISRTVTVI
jgi:hypothetical protein